MTGKARGPRHGISRIRSPALNPTHCAPLHEIHERIKMFLLAKSKHREQS